MRTLKKCKPWALLFDAKIKKKKKKKIVQNTFLLLYRWHPQFNLTRKRAK